MNITSILLSSFFLLLTRASVIDDRADIEISLEPEDNNNGKVTFKHKASPETTFSTLIQTLYQRIKNHNNLSVLINPLNINGIENMGLDSMKLYEIMQKIGKGSTTNSLTMTYKILKDQEGSNPGTRKSDQKRTIVLGTSDDNYYVAIPENGHHRQVEAPDKCFGVGMCCLCVAMIMAIVIGSLVYFYEVSATI